MQNELIGRSLILHVKDELQRRRRAFCDCFDSCDRSIQLTSKDQRSAETMLREVLAMPAIKRLVLKGPAINNSMLQTIFDVRELEHLELVYAPVDVNRSKRSSIYRWSARFDCLART